MGKEILNATDKTKKLYQEKLAKEIHYYSFVQFIFQKQWIALRDYAHEKDIEIIGDIPIFVALDSADVWSNKKLFQLDTKGYATSVAGSPTRLFQCDRDGCGAIRSMIGTTSKATGYKWSIDRIRRQGSGC